MASMVVTWWIVCVCVCVGGGGGGEGLHSVKFSL